MNASTVDSRAKGFMEYLRRYTKDRGARAHLRGGLSPARRPNAWPLLGRFPGAIGNPAFEVVAGLWAAEPELDRNGGNLGDAAAKIRANHSSFEGRFSRLLACDRAELPARVAPVVRAAQARGIPIDYARLLSDLLRWNESVRTEWATSFWSVEEPDEVRPELLDREEP
jgi:CRISPR type I-E-associated protein CasB/Cse2